MNSFKVKSAVVNPCILALKTECQPKNSKHLLLLEHNIPCTRHVKFEKLKYLFRFWWHFVSSLQDMNNIPCPAHGNFFSTWVINLYLCFVINLTFLLGMCILDYFVVPCHSKNKHKSFKNASADLPHKQSDDNFVQYSNFWFHFYTLFN